MAVRAGFRALMADAGLAAMALALMPLSVPARAATPAEKIAAMDDAALFLRFGKEVVKLGKPSVCEAAPYADELERRRPAQRLMAFAALIRSNCALLQDRYPDTLREAEQAEGLGFGRDGDELRVLVDFLALQAALFAGNGDAYAEHLGHVAARGNAAEFAGLQPRAVSYGLRTAGMENQGRALLALARSPAFPSLPPEMRGLVAAKALRPALAAGDSAVADMLVGELRFPKTALDMLVDRDYESGWPLLAHRVGPHAQTMLLQSVETATADLAKAPEDRTLLSHLVDALVDAGRFDEAIAVAQRIDHTDKGLRKAGEYEGWIINAEVRALDALGRTAEADALFDRLTALPWRERGWMVNFAINRAERLVRHGVWERAVLASALATEVANEQGSPYARLSASAQRLCAMHHAQPGQDLRLLREAIYAHWRDSIEDAVQAARCLGDDATAQRFLKDGLADAKMRYVALELLQPDGVKIVSDPANTAPRARTLMDTDADLRAAYDRAGRDLPEDLRPARR